MSFHFKSSEERHPERRAKAAFRSFEEREMSNERGKSGIETVTIERINIQKMESPHFSIRHV